MCQPAWSRTCNRSRLCAEGCPECMGADEGRGRLTAALLRHQGSGGEDQAASKQCWRCDSR
jgi:hypothetical protein